MPKPLTDDLIVGDILHQWTIQEYEQYQRSVRWYILMISIGLFFVVYGLFSNNFLFSLIIILSAIILFIQSHQDPIQISFSITELGLILNDRFYNYSELDKFYIIYQPPEIKNLFIETKSSLRPMLSIPLLDENPVEVREKLLEFLDEDFEKEEEPRSITIARRWKIH